MCVRSWGFAPIWSTIALIWLKLAPAGVGKSWYAGPYDPGPKSPGSNPRFAHFSSVIKFFHQGQPHSASSSSVLTPLINAVISAIAAFDACVRSRSVKSGKPSLKSYLRCPGAKRVHAESSNWVPTLRPWARISLSKFWYCSSRHILRRWLYLLSSAVQLLIGDTQSDEGHKK